MIDRPKLKLKAASICLTVFLALTAITLALFLGGIWTQDERWSQTGLVFLAPTVIALFAFICTIDIN